MFSVVLDLVIRGLLMRFGNSFHWSIISSL
jgi:hypothetical protein